MPKKPALLIRPFLNGASRFRIVGPRDGNGNRRDLSIDARDLGEEPVHVTAEEFRRIACLAGLRRSLDAEDAEADRAENPDDYDDAGEPKAGG